MAGVHSALAAEVVDPTQGESALPPTGGRRASAVRGGIWSAASQLVPAVGTAVLSVAAGRYLGSERLGQQSLIAYTNAAVAFVVVASLNTAVLQSGGRLQGHGDVATLRTLTRWAIGAHIGAGALVLTVVAGTGLAVGHNLAAWFVIGAVSVLDAWADGLAIRLILAEGWAPIGRLRLIFQFLGPPLGLVFLFAGFGVTGIFVGDGIAALGLLAAASARYRRMNRDRPFLISEAQGTARRPAPYRRIAPQDQRVSARPPVALARSFVLFAVGGLITQVVSRRVEFIVLAAFAGDVAVGMYSVAFMAVNLLSMVPVGIAVAAMPLVAAASARGESDAAGHHLRLALRLGTAVSIPLTAVLATLGPTAVLLVYGRAYDTAARLVPLASVSLLVAVIGGVCSQYWAGQNRLGIVLGTGALAAVVDLSVALALVPSLHATGAALANLAGQFSLAAGLLVATVRETGPIGWRPASLITFAFAAAVGAAAAVTVWVLVDQFGPGGFVTDAVIVLVLGSVAAVALTLVTAATVRVFDAEEAEWLRPLLPHRAQGLLTRLSTPARGE